MRRVLASSIISALLAVVVPGTLPGGTAVVPAAAADAQNRIDVPVGGDLQAALDAAQPGDLIALPAGATFVGNFVLPKKSGTKWIVLYSSAFWRLLSPGTELSLSDADFMPKIVSPNGDPAIRTAAGAHNYMLIGLEVTTANPATINLVQLEGSATQTQEQVPTDILLYRCYIHGTPDGDIRRGVALNGARIAVIGSYFSDFHERGGDSQAIQGFNGPGPFKIIGNYLEAAGENIMFGGQDPSIPNLVPADIDIRGNHLSKPLSWKVGDPSYAGIPWIVKNLFELKNARRVRVEGNIFEHNWVQADQDGFAVVFTPRNQDGTAPWSVVEDVTFANNIVRHATAGIIILGWDNFNPSAQTNQILIRNNLFADIGGAAWAGADRTGRLFQLVDGTADVEIDHNTAFHTENPLVATVIVSGRELHTGFVFTNNIVLHNQYGVSGDGTIGNALLTLATYFPSAVFAGNVVVGGDPAMYPPANFFPATLGAVGFVDYAGGDYRLAPDSAYHDAGTNGEDIGVAVTALEAALLRWW